MAHDSALLSTRPMAEGYSILRNDANDWIVELLSCPGSRGTRALEEAEMINLHMTPKANYFWPWEDTSLGGLDQVWSEVSTRALAPSLSIPAFTGMTTGSCGTRDRPHRLN